MAQAIARQIKMYHKVLSTYATNAKLELALLITVQVGGCRWLPDWVGAWLGGCSWVPGWLQLDWWEELKWLAGWLEGAGGCLSWLAHQQLP